MVNGAVQAFERMSIKYWRPAVVAWVILVVLGPVAFGPLALIVALISSNIGFPIGLFIAMRKALMSIKYWWLGVAAWVILVALGGVALGPLGLIVALMGSNIGFAIGLRVGIRQGLGLWGDV